MSLDQEVALTIAQAWLDASAQTATDKQFDEHFNLISKRVQVTGVPGFESISYEDWARQSKQEFKDNVLKAVTYQGLKVTATNEKQIMFKTIESIFANDGTNRAHGVEILIEKEADDVWRAIRERVMVDDESRHAGLM